MLSLFGKKPAPGGAKAGKAAAAPEQINPKVIEIKTRLQEYSIEISIEQAKILSERSSTVDGSIEYYFLNSSMFDAPPAPPADIAAAPNAGAAAGAVLPPRPAREGDVKARARSIAAQLIAMGIPVDKALKASLRCSSVEAAMAFAFEDGPALAEPTFTCPTCFDDYPAGEMVTLECHHRLCKDCFVGYCSSKITENMVDEKSLVCPQMTAEGICGNSITVFELQANLSSELFDKYNSFKIGAYCEERKMTSCPKCNVWYIDLNEVLGEERRWRNITCGNCAHIFCGKCGQRPHKGQPDQDIDCAAYQEWLRQNDQSEQEFRKYLEAQRIFPCPKCKNAGELSTGCKFLYCRCKANFCALCGIQLKQAQHYSHFQNGPGCTGPYGEGCLGLADTAGVDPPDEA